MGVIQNILDDLIIHKIDTYSCYATGDIKRYEANKEILNKDLPYISIQDLENATINPDKNAIIIFCGIVNEESRTKIINKGYQTVDMFEIINHKSNLFWNQKKEYVGVDLNHYCSNPIIVSYSQKINRHVRSLKEYINTYFNTRKDLTCLSLGCGCGKLERDLLKLGIFKRIDACDISEESIIEARNKAKIVDENSIINYFVADMNSDTFKDNEYDLIIANSCMHHIENLEFAYTNINNALKKDGIFYQSEYINEDRFQFCRSKILIVNTLLMMFPKKWKNRCRYRKPKLINMLNTDPSEAVRSSEIVSLSGKYFDIIDIKYLYGALMHILYQCVNPNYFHTNDNKPFLNKIRTLFLCKLVYGVEKLLLKSQKDTGVIISRKKYENS